MGTILVIALFSGLFVADNKEFFDQVEKEVNEGYEWNYVGKQSLDPSAKSISAQVEGEEPYIFWKLKKPE
jgi:hypothetical protein|tara:strand:- start:964 stop:1173 length:210 start_codon:yes stop_codon:yes gene_type:complete